MFKSARVRVLLAISVAIWLTTLGGCAALHHAHDGHGAGQLTLNDGKRWATDEPLRQGMSRIREAMEAQLPSIRAGQVADQTYSRLATDINGDIAYMVKNCKLDKQTDAMLHLAIADIIAGTDAMLGKDKQSSRREGALMIAGALNEYGKYFDHPGWRALSLE